MIRCGYADWMYPPPPPEDGSCHRTAAAYIVNGVVLIPLCVFHREYTDSLDRTPELDTQFLAQEVCSE